MPRFNFVFQLDPNYRKCTFFTVYCLILSFALLAYLLHKNLNSSWAWLIPNSDVVGSAHQCAKVFIHLVMVETLIFGISMVRDVDMLYVLICILLIIKFASSRIHIRIAVQSFWRNLEDAGATCFFLLLKKLGRIARKVHFSFGVKFSFLFMLQMAILPNILCLFLWS